MFTHSRNERLRAALDRPTSSRLVPHRATIYLIRHIASWIFQHDRTNQLRKSTSKYLIEDVHTVSISSSYQRHKVNCAKPRRQASSSLLHLETLFTVASSSHSKQLGKPYLNAFTTATSLTTITTNLPLSMHLIELNNPSLRLTPQTSQTRSSAAYLDVFLSSYPTFASARCLLRVSRALTLNMNHARYPFSSHARYYQELSRRLACRSFLHRYRPASRLAY